MRIKLYNEYTRKEWIERRRAKKIMGGVHAILKKRQKYEE